MRDKIITHIFNDFEMWKELFIKNRIRHRDDMKQIIMYEVCKLDIEKLKPMYDENTYKFFILRILLNQKNCNRTEYGKLDKLSDVSTYYNIIIKDDDFQSHKSKQIEIIEDIENYKKDQQEKENKYIHIFDKLKANTGDEYTDLSLNLYSIYYNRKYVKQDKITYRILSKEIGVNRNLIVDMIKHAKKIIKDTYDN